MSETLRNLSGRTLDTNVALGDYLGGTETTAVYQTIFSGQKAVAKLFVVEAERSEAELLRLKQAEKLSHPNLLRVLKTGHGEANGLNFVYVVTEFAEENLAQVLPERALTPQEAQDVLQHSIDALAYLHSQGFVHSDLKPANILAQGDQLKLSTDSLHRVGDPLSRPPNAHDAPEAHQRLSPASDVWSLGMTLVEILTQHLPFKSASENVGPAVPESVPAPFREIAQHCLLRTPELRWSLEDISAKLGGGTKAETPVSPAPQPEAPQTSKATLPKRSKRPLIMVVVVAVIAAGLVILSRHPENNNPPAPSTANSQTSAPSNQVPQPSGSTTPPSPTTETAKPEENATLQSQSASSTQSSNPEGEQTTDQSSASEEDGSEQASHDGVVRKVMPDVLPAAQRSIEGKVRVKLALEVNSSGKVIECKLLSSPSKYFARVSEEAARGWKFAPASADSRMWHVEFEFRRSGTEVRAKQQ